MVRQLAVNQPMILLTGYVCRFDPCLSSQFYIACYSNGNWRVFEALGLIPILGSNPRQATIFFEIPV